MINLSVLKRELQDQFHESAPGFVTNRFKLLRSAFPGCDIRLYVEGGVVARLLYKQRDLSPDSWAIEVDVTPDSILVIDCMTERVTLKKWSASNGKVERKTGSGHGIIRRDKP